MADGVGAAMVVPTGLVVHTGDAVIEHEAIKGVHSQRRELLRRIIVAVVEEAFLSIERDVLSSSSWTRSFATGVPPPASGPPS